MGIVLAGRKHYTIHKAIDYILDHELYDVEIVSDSRSALMTVESLSDSREFISQLKKRLKNREGIKLMSVRVHKGEMGNERADLLAKEASNGDLIDLQFIYSKVQIKNINNKKLTENWQCIWMQSKNGKLTRLNYPEINMTRLSAKFYYNQIITGHGIFGAFQNRMFGKDCKCQCGEDETIKHVLMECPVRAQQRDKLPQN
ncbi:hypothetical protein AVEN_226774-1 [Araneus ventricosus]|uniref:RNase H type-1 domain-containing protein n=1 Tax=Araneus ventricosus TaxID=182803 RepID=A0A4Y2S5G6_ARAVE|nr:hypothetical protein AVEN_226774-1 [Araneus ventricosus]